MNTMLWRFSLVLVLVCTFNAGAVEPVLPQNVYRMGANDVIRIQVFGEDDLTVETRVGGDGKINYPLLGVLQVGGQTIEEVQKVLTARLASGYLKQPKVSVSIVRHRNFYVGGEVKTPGGYPYENGLTVQKAITMAGGFTEKSDRTGLTVTRLNGQGETLLPEANTLVMPDDLIVVRQLQKFYVNGEVKKPGEYAYEKGLTVHKAITMAGGFTDKAVTKRAKVLRNINGEERTLEIALDAPVLPQDIIVVAQRFF
jgi:protein involved in polysaccharide export with SLBB domain